MANRRRFPFWRIVAGLVVGLTIGIGAVEAGTAKLSTLAAVCLTIDNGYASIYGPQPEYDTYMYDTITRTLARFQSAQISRLKAKSPDGQYVVHERRDAAGVPSTQSPLKLVFRSRKDGKTVVHSDPHLLDIHLEHQISWSPDGNRVAYTAQVRDHSKRAGSSQYAVVIASADGSNYEILPQADYPSQPFEWSSDSQYLLVSVGNVAKLIKADGSHEWAIHPVQQNSQAMVQWSPDGHEAAFIQDEQVHFLEPYDMGGAHERAFPLRHLTSKEVVAIEWSPDGRYLLVYASNFPDEWAFFRLVLFAKDGSQPKNLGTMNWEMHFRVAWSADSTFLVYVDAETRALTSYHINSDHREKLTAEIVTNVAFSNAGTVFVTLKQYKSTSIFAANILDKRLTPILSNLDGVEALQWLDGEGKLLGVITRVGTKYNIAVVHVPSFEVQHLRSDLMNAGYFFFYDSTHITYLWETQHGTLGIDAYELNSRRVTSLAVDAAQIALLRTKPAPGFVDVSTENVYRNTYWSPDRGTATVRTFDAQTTNMHIAYSDGRAPRMIRRGVSQLSDWADWSPDGSMIAFTQQTNMNGAWSLEVVRADGKDLWHFDLPEGYNWYGWQSCSPIP